MIVPSLTNVTREVVPMHVCLQNVVRLLYARLKRMKEYAIALKVILAILSQHVIQLHLQLLHPSLLDVIIIMSVQVILHAEIGCVSTHVL
jgi:hypothetical protein